MDNQHAWYSIKEAAKILGVSYAHIYTLEKRGQLRIERNPLYGKGGRVRVNRADVEALLAARPRP